MEGRFPPSPNIRSRPVPGPRPGGATDDSAGQPVARSTQRCSGLSHAGALADNASMRTRTLVTTAAAVFCNAFLSGCGVARDLTTQHRTVTYTASLPPVPANSMSHTQIALSDEVRSTYSKYHGGVDWTRLAYEAQN